MNQSTLVLADLRVVEYVSSNLGAVTCGRMLSQLGADVLMIEPPEGHAYRRVGVTCGTGHTDMFETAARGKRSLALDLREPTAVETLVGIILEADVLLVDRHYYGELSSRKVLERIARDNDSLIICCISPFGLSGPYSEIAGSELTVQALAGVLETNGEQGDPPLQAGIPVASHGGALYALISILAALYERQHSGLGQLLDQSEFDALISFQGTLIPGYLMSGEEFERLGNRHNLTAPWNHYRTCDDWIVIATVGNEQWARLARLIGRPEVIDSPEYRHPPDRLRNVVSLDAMIEEWSTTRTSAQALLDLEAAEVLSSRILTLSEALGTAHAADRMIDVQEDGVAAALPFRLSRSAPRKRADVPLLNRRHDAWSGARFPAGRDQATKDPTGPLAGIRVVEVAVLTAGPLTGRLLGMLGADVIKIESPGGERARHMGYQIAGASYMYHLNNTDKGSCRLDMARPEDREAFTQIANSAHVFITNIGQKSLEAIGASPEMLAKANPQLIYSITSGYGATGSMSGRKAFDTTIQANTGIMSLTGMPDGHPLKIALSIVDLFSALSATAGILAALICQKREGHGQLVDVALFDTGIWATQNHWPALFNKGIVSSRQGNRHRYFAPHGCFRAIDGWIALSVESDEHWNALLRAMGRGQLIGDARFAQSQDRISHVSEVEALVGEWVQSRSVDDIVGTCVGVRVAAAPVLKLSEAVEHPLTSARQMIVKFPKPAIGSIRLIGAAIKMSRSNVEIRRAAPEIGEDNGRILDRDYP